MRGPRVTLRRARPASTPPSGRRVSVVIPCYNYGRFLGSCVDSVLSQAGVDPEVLIVDDASTDGSAEVARALAAAEPRVRVIAREVNRGHIATYNEGLSQVDGDYVVLLSADDLLPAGSLGRAVALFEAFPKVGLVYGNPINFFDERPPPVSTRVRGWSVWPGHDWIADRCGSGRNPIYSPEVVLRGSIHRQLGGYDPALPHSGDLDMWMRAAVISDVGRVNGADQGLRRIHGSNMSETDFAGALRDFIERRKAYDAFFTGAGAGLPRAGEWQARARRSLATAALDHACRFAGGAEDPAGAGDEAVQAYVDFARDCVGDPSRLSPWTELSWRLHGMPGVGGQIRDRLYRTRRDLRARVLWRRWRWSGV